MKGSILRSVLVLASLAFAACSGSEEPGANGPGAGGTGGTAGAGGTGGTAGSGGTGGGEVHGGLTLFDYVIAVGVSQDGKTAVFQDITSSTTADAIVYDVESGKVAHTVALGEPSRVLATGISNTGRMTAMQGDPLRASVWTADGEWSDIESPFEKGCGEDVGSAWSVSADGEVVVGLTWNGCSAEAFRWTDTGGTPVYKKLEVIGEPFEDSTVAPTNRATKVSADGRVAAGFAQLGGIDRSPAIWNEDGEGLLLAPDATDAPGEVLSIDGTGTTVAGNLGGDGFVWTEAGGFKTLERFDLAMPSDPVYPNAMTADGKTVFGGVGDAFFSLPTAFAWTEAGGMRPLSDVVVAAGIEIPEGLWLGNVLGASADGSVLVGTAMEESGMTKTFLLRLPEGTFAP